MEKINFSPGSPNFLGSRKSQWKKTNTMNTPPPMRRRGDDFSIARTISGLLEKVSVRACRKDLFGKKSQTIRNGRSPLTTNTPNNRPQKRNHFRAAGFMVERTSALMMALSTLDMISKRERPSMANTAGKSSIGAIIKDCLQFDPESIILPFCMSEREKALKIVSTHCSRVGCIYVSTRGNEEDVCTRRSNWQVVFRFGPWGNGCDYCTLNDGKLSQGRLDRKGTFHVLSDAYNS